MGTSYSVPCIHASAFDAAVTLPAGTRAVPQPSQANPHNQSHAHHVLQHNLQPSQPSRHTHDSTCHQSVATQACLYCEGARTQSKTTYSPPVGAHDCPLLFAARLMRHGTPLGQRQLCGKAQTNKGWSQGNSSVQHVCTCVARPVCVGRQCEAVPWQAGMLA